jgi:glyoxylase-like metal-dependent hydrolase (beta-lactamase superfamily II)
MKQSGNLYPNITTTVKLKGKDIKIHAISTGMVAVKNNFMTKKGPGFLSKLNIIFDQTFTEYLPIWVWVIEHPEGTIMIDTGEIASVNDKDHLKGENAYARFVAGSISKFSMEAEDNLNFKLDQVNMKTEDIKMIALTHLHLDHTDGIRFFPKGRIYRQ